MELNFLLNNRFCTKNSLNPNLVKGKIVLCEALSTGTGAFLAGAAGAVMADRGTKDSASSFPLPVSYLGAADGSSIASYLSSTRYVPFQTYLCSTSIWRLM